MASKKQIVASALIPDSFGRIFVQKRTMSRRLFPGCWDLVGGHVDEGEHVFAALNREIEEETGWKLRTIIEELTVKPWSSNGTEYEERQFIVTVDGDLERPSLETAKVSEGLWVDRTNIERLKENREPGDQLIYDSVLEALNRLKKGRSSIG
ncbi:hypothetical protein XI07_18890 [Bradyrhizobium sp. CCBAU 11445]|uniref:NUDIX domain-containing protein n=1 Tax=unclassified Bradyrhizobium TaxID=2631580 RepID=UPI002306D455|nr:MULTISPECIES: NUDIX domain-containing protein [unclassified Bradyrhizobium]MDA9484040.1 hypothetical protein [Bradyrhizobium sp. CCBAU 11445]MDA9522359.1 hypothetical protein [Bradyrhizobium sp. CCBAU 11434]